MTKFEKIKQMSSREFAEFLENYGACDCCLFCAIEENLDEKKCVESHIDWLESEVEEK